MINVTIWNEFHHEKEMDNVKKIYPLGIHEYIASFLREDKELNVRTAYLDMPECGLTDEVLENTDVLIWWGHCHHHEVPDEIAKKVCSYVQKGMGFIPLHSSHLAKPFVMLMGTTCTLKWREGDFERIWNIAPNHPIAKGVDDYFELDEEEMYGERFDIPAPDEIVFLSWFAGGELFRSGCCWTRGLGKIFYFQPGHECNPTYYNKTIQTILNNAVHWACPNKKLAKITCPNAQPMKNHK